MSEPGDIWQRYDAKVVQIQQLEARLAALEKDLATAHHERDHWARVGRQLSKKLQVARALAERLRAAQHGAAPSTQRPAELQAPAESGGVRAEYDRAREVLGLVLTALTKALDDDDEAVAELGRRLRHHAGGKLLYSITRGALTLVPVDGRYLVDRTWLARLDLAALRSELDIAAQSGVYPQPEDMTLVHTQPGPQALGSQFRPPRAQARVVQPPASHGSDLDDLQVDLENDDLDAYGDESIDLPPPPPMPTTSGFFPPPPLLAALPPDEAVPAKPREPSRPVEASPAPARPQEDTVRTRPSQPPQPLSGPLIPNLRIGRLIKTPSGG